MADLFLMIMDVCKGRTRKIGRSFCLLALLLCTCAKVSDHCSDHNPLDPNSEFCHDGKSYPKCSGYALDPAETEECDEICDDWVVTKPATCSAQGEETRACPNGHTESQKTAKLTGSVCVTDTRPDGQIYSKVKIGNLTWLAQNLNYLTEDSWCYENKPSNCDKYGRLYTWNAAIGACPAGWRLPSNEEWDGLISAVGSSAGTKLKSKAVSWNGTDLFGFSAMPGGSRNAYGSFSNIDDLGYWWTATDDGGYSAYYRSMGSSINYVSEFDLSKDRGFSVRCVQQ